MLKQILATNTIQNRVRGVRRISLLISGLKGTGHNKFVRRGSTLSGVGGLSKTRPISSTLLALKFELTKKNSAGKSQHCLINEKSEG